MKSTLKIVVLLAVLQLSLQAGFECSVNGCQLCTYPNACGQCQSNWLLTQNMTSGALYCQQLTCVDNCLTCYQDNTCQVCNTNFYLTSSGGCSSTQTSSASLPPSCAWGYNSENCTLCNYGYTLQDGFCYPTIVMTYRDTNCMIKLTPSMCQICKSGYIVNVLGQCVTTQVNETCTAANCMYCANANNTCTTCSSGYQLSSSNTCEALPCSIAGCTMCASSSECQTCGDGYWINSAKSCVAAAYGCTVSNCQACDATPQSCSLCSVGYQLAAFNVGGNMVNMCRKIVCPYNVTNCNACTQHYNEVKMYNQILCAPSSCATGYIHINGYCVTNVSTSAFACGVANCGQCSFDNFCSICNTGYTLTSWGSCVKTTCDVANCASCSINNICSACNSGYSLTGNLSIVMPTSTYEFACALNNQCRMTSSLTCNVNYCSYCTSNNVCASCMSGYDFDSTNTNCVATCNVTNCYECNEGQEQTCNVCQPGFQLSSDMLGCTPMAASCDYCSNSSATNCIWNWAQNTSECMACNEGYTLYGGVCYAETCSIYGCDLCASWNTPVTCMRCQQGLFMDNGYCIKLNCNIANCSNCVQNGKCLGCMKGYLLQVVNSTTNQCVAESTVTNCGVDNCLSCSSTKGNMWCQTCAAPYVVNSADGSCVCKWQNCLECSFSSLACSTCPPNLLATLKEPNCIPQPSLKLTCSVANCEYCLTSSQCSVCALGYALVANNLTCTLNDCSALGQSNCQLCDQYGYECHLCSTGWQLDNTLEGGSCFQVSNNYTCDVDGCAVCQTSDSSMCASCLPYYSLSNGTCTAYTCSIANCLFCLEENFCTVCGAGYYLNTDLSCQVIDQTVLTSCSSNIAFCFVCATNVSSNTETCYRCMEGFEFSSNAGACIPQTNSIDNCKFQVTSLTGLPACIVCTQGYFMNSWGTCSLYSPQLANTGCSVYNCLHCAVNSTTCSFCFEPWGISETGQCQTNNTSICTDSNCQSCSNSSYCFTCVNTYRPYLGSCLQCQVKGCDYCKTPNTCSSCLDNYNLLSNGFCLICDITNCNKCSENNVCQTCSNSTGVALEVSSDRTACLECTNNNCAFCSSTNNCGICDNGYQLWPLSPSSSTTQNCVTCNVANCLTCNSNNNCYTCAQGYSAISNGSCIACNTPCATCNSNGSCATCQTPYYASAVNSSGDCFVSTVPLCATYNTSDTTQCLVCNTGYTLNSSSNTCILTCPQSCATCSTGNSSNCLTCNSGYYLTSGNSCSACTDSGCSNCTANTSQCTTCFTGYYLINNECKICPQFCSSCTSSTSCAGLSNSQSQRTLFTQSNGQTVLAVCAQGCTTCSNANPQICTQCADGLYLSSGVCMKCPTTCRTCSSSNSSQCLSCYKNSFLSGTNCITCNSNCLTCQSANNPDTCLSCRQGSFVSNGKCVTGCPSNCISCSSANTCTSCLSGYTLFSQGSQVVCASCISSCRTCSKGQPANCLSCGDGFYLSGSTCTACTSNCESCSALGCSTCSDGYFLTSSQTCAVECTLPCGTCSSTNPSKCSSCIAGYSYSSTSFTCSQILTCDGACSVCPLGYALSEGQCTQCTTSNCMLCSASTPGTCQSCMSGYYLDSSNQCIACGSSCSSCQEGDSCTSCAAGFTTTDTSTTGSNGFLCDACVSPCATCSGSTTTCSSCVSGFTFNGWKCVQNFHFFFSLTFQTTQATFNTNYFSFLIALANALTSNGDTDSVTVFSITFGSVVTSGAAQPSATSGTKDANSQYSSLDATLAENNEIAGMTIVDSSVTVVGGSVDYNDVDLALILGICIPVGILLIVGIALFVYCKKKKSSDIIEQRIKEDSGFTVRESFELSNQYRNDDTARGFEQTTAIN